jgi:protease-4
MRFFSTLAASTLGALLAILLCMFFGFMFIVAIAASADTTPSVRPSSVLVFDLSGTIPDRVSGDPFAQALGLEAPFGMWDATEALRKAAADTRIKALWIRMRGSAIAWPIATEVRQAIETFKESGKTVIASSEDFPVTENALYIASAADSVFAGPDTFVEFNGFYIASEFYKRLLTTLNVEPQIVRAGEYKGAVEPFTRESLSAENREQLNAILVSQEESFVETLAKARGMSTSDIRTTMNEFGIGSSADALGRDLIDGIRYHDQTVASLKAATGIDSDADLVTIRMADYVKVPARRAGLRTSGDAEIAVVYMQGPIVSGSGNSPGLLTPGSVRPALKRARESSRVKAIVIRIDSPGGSVSASDAILREIRETAAQKPVFVSMGGVAASGGYWIAMAADSVVADPLTITGSIGVFSLFFNVGDLYEDKLGITHDVLRSNPQADMLSGLRPFSDIERARMQTSVDETYASFLDIVASSRSMTLERVDELGRGRVWSGADALEMGLVDVLGGLRDAIALAASRVDLSEGEYTVRLLPAPLSFMQRLSRGFSAVAAKVQAISPLTEFERSVLDRARLFESLTRDAGTVQARLPFDVRIQ